MNDLCTRYNALSGPQKAAESAARCPLLGGLYEAIVARDCARYASTASFCGFLGSNQTLGGARCGAGTPCGLRQCYAECLRCWPAQGQNGCDAQVLAGTVAARDVTLCQTLWPRDPIVTATPVPSAVFSNVTFTPAPLPSATPAVIVAEALAIVEGKVTEYCVTCPKAMAMVKNIVNALAGLRASQVVVSPADSSYALSSSKVRRRDRRRLAASQSGRTTVLIAITAPGADVHIRTLAGLPPAQLAAMGIDSVTPLSSSSSGSSSSSSSGSEGRGFTGFKVGGMVIGIVFGVAVLVLTIVLASRGDCCFKTAPWGSKIQHQHQHQQQQGQDLKSKRSERDQEEGGVKGGVKVVQHDMSPPPSPWMRRGGEAGRSRLERAGLKDHEGDYAVASPTVKRRNESSSSSGSSSSDQEETGSKSRSSSRSSDESPQSKANASSSSSSSSAASSSAASSSAASTAST